MAHNDVNNLLIVGTNNNDEPVDNLRNENQHDGSISKTHLNGNEPTSNRVEGNTWRTRNPTPDDMDDELVVDIVKV